MGFFGKLKFWKKDDEFSDLGLGNEDLGFSSSQSTGLGLPKEGLPTQESPEGIAPKQSPEYPDLSKPYTTTPVQQAETGSTDMYKISKEVEVISSKIDALKASMDSINQRLANLERIAEGDKKKSW